MPYIGLDCEGCGDRLGEERFGYSAGRSARKAAAELREDADARGWRRDVLGRWLCRSCQRIERETAGRCGPPSLVPPGLASTG